MGWKGTFFGAWVGSFFGGPLGALLGAVAGNKLEHVLTDAVKETNDSSRTSHRAMAFTAASAAILAKMAKADGVVTRDEIAFVEMAFSRLGFSSVARDYAIEVFRKAKDDEHSIYEYASEFAAAVTAIELRELFYQLLWDLAEADGHISAGELEILRRIPAYLRIRAGWYETFARERLGARGHGKDDSLEEAYELLGVSSSADSEELKRAYRELAKRHHPDMLRARGLPEELVGKATEKMSRINAAWEKIKLARGIA